MYKPPVAENVSSDAFRYDCGEQYGKKTNKEYGRGKQLEKKKKKNNKENDRGEQYDRVQHENARLQHVEYENARFREQYARVREQLDATFGMEEQDVQRRELLLYVKCE